MKLSIDLIGFAFFDATQLESEEEYILCSTICSDELYIKGERNALVRCAFGRFFPVIPIHFFPSR